MATEIGGYREYDTATCAAATHNLDLDKIGEGHKAYVNVVGARTSREDADVEVFIVTGGQEFLIGNKLDLDAAEGYAQWVSTWVYTAEFLRFKFGGLTSGDTVEAWAVGVDKWEIQAEE